MSRKKIKINIKSQQEETTPTPKPEPKTNNPTPTPKNKETKKSKEPIPEKKKKLSTAEKIRRAKEARKTSKNPEEEKKIVKEKAKTKKKSKNGFSLIGMLVPILLLVGLVYLSYDIFFGESDEKIVISDEDDLFAEEEEEETIPIKKDDPNYKYGIDKRTYNYEENVVLEDMSLNTFFEKWKLPRGEIQQLASDVRSLIRPSEAKEGNLYGCFFDKGNTRMPRFVAYEHDNYHYVVFTLLDSVGAKIVKRDVKKERKTFTGTIQTDIGDLHSRKKLNFQLLPQMEEALAWTVDFYHLKPGAHYKLLYDEIYADGEPVGSRIHALEFTTGKETIRAFYFDNGFDRGFFDERARPMKRAYLKSPVKYARISSRFNLTRKHPVLEKIKPHLGTDYAAPKGTPIRAISDGVITIAKFKSNNGNYVKMKHDNTYESQYLHMDGFAPGIKPGVSVKQGQTIGYVGTTGLSTGPHVCFRFWKKGKQVDFLKEDLPDSRPIARSQTADFLAHRDSLSTMLEKIN